jgi:hypothetical protein
MIYARIENGIAVEASTEHQHTPGWECRHDWRTMERARDISRQLTAKTGTLYIPVDRGSNTSPRYDVIKAPALGDKVSKYFNGDSYPAGEIVKISPTMKRIETSTGAVFYRERQSGAWVEGGTWSMQAGHHEERNPSV